MHLPALVIALLLWLAPGAAEAGCRPGLAPNDAQSCQAQRREQARLRALRIVAEPRAAGPTRRTSVRAAPGNEGPDAAGRASDAEARLRSASGGDAGRARQREFQRERVERAARETQRSDALLERSRALRGGRALPRGTIGIGLPR